MRDLFRTTGPVFNHTLYTRKLRFPHFFPSLPRNISRCCICMYPQYPQPWHFLNSFGTFYPQTTKNAERFCFHKRDQADGKSLAVKVAELHLAIHWKSGDSLNKTMRSGFVFLLSQEHIQKSLFPNQNWKKLYRYLSPCKCQLRRHFS